MTHPGEFKLLKYEQTAWTRGKMRVAGIDEAGRGPLAGPVVAAAVVLPSSLNPSEEANQYLLEINDSKKLTPKKRERLYILLMEDVRVLKAVSVIPAEKIDAVNILNATYLAMSEALLKIAPVPDHVMVDGRALPEKYFFCSQQGVTQEGIIKGDSKSLSIAAASILAKVHRDRLMMEYDARFPEYLFGRHKGYGTQEHVEKIKEFGPSPIHRKSFSPLREMLGFPSRA